jgi:hypothetical protein
MTTTEFVQHMPPTALVDTIASVWNDGSENDAETQVIRACWEQLCLTVGMDDAFNMVSSAIGGLMFDFMEVV